MDEKNAGQGYLALTPKATLKLLEAPYVYLIDHDELYEVNDETLEFLSGCNGQNRGDMACDDEFIGYCLSEGILEVLPEPSFRPVRAAKSPLPSLRFLELQVTSRCNLSCLHCYQTKAPPVDLPLSAALSVVRQFEEMAGLKLLISGGEPMLYPRIFDFLDQTAGVSVRRVLITNGTLIDARNAGRLGVEEVQISLDGWERGHDTLRGAGSFDKAVRGLEAVRMAGIDVSVATMIHRDNLDQFDRMAAFVEEIGALSWGIDVPCASGRPGQAGRISVSPEEAAPFMSYAFGGGGHTTPGFACGHHLMTVLPSGHGVKCGFFADHPFGDAVAALSECRRLMPTVRADELDCRGCPQIDACGGGCRFRAADSRTPDPVMCAVFGVSGNERMLKRT